MNRNKTGVWMDYRYALVIDPYSIDPEFEVLVSHNAVALSENHAESQTTSFQQGQYLNPEFKIHEKETGHEKYYFKKLADKLKDYDEVFLFGPTNASLSFFLKLREMNDFRDKKISWEKADKLSDTQLLAKVRTHFFH